MGSGKECYRTVLTFETSSVYTKRKVRSSNKKYLNLGVIIVLLRTIVNGLMNFRVQLLRIILSPSIAPATNPLTPSYKAFDLAATDVPPGQFFIY